MLALTLWSVVQVRASMAGRIRWVVYALLGGLAVASVGGSVETIALAHDDRALAMPGQTLRHRRPFAAHDLRRHRQPDRRAAQRNRGNVGELGAHHARSRIRIPASAPTTAPVKAGAMTRRTRRTATRWPTDLHQLLAVAGEHGPYLLAGHSLGGVYSLAFAAQYPNDVAGVVLLDSSSPEQFALPGLQRPVRDDPSRLQRPSIRRTARPRPTGQQQHVVDAAAAGGRTGPRLRNQQPRLRERQERGRSLPRRDAPGAGSSGRSATSPWWS